MFMNSITYAYCTSEGTVGIAYENFRIYNIILHDRVITDKGTFRYGKRGDELEKVSSQQQDNT